MNDDLPKNWQDEPVDRNIVEDLADVLARMVTGWEDKLGVDLAEHHDVQRVMRRVYKWRVRHLEMTSAEMEQMLVYGRQVVVDCNIWGNSIFSCIDGVIQHPDQSKIRIEL